MSIVVGFVTTRGPGRAAIRRAGGQAPGQRPRRHQLNAAGTDRGRIVDAVLAEASGNSRSSASKFITRARARHDPAEDVVGVATRSAPSASSSGCASAARSGSSVMSSTPSASCSTHLPRHLSVKGRSTRLTTDQCFPPGDALPISAPQDTEPATLMTLNQPLDGGRGAAQRGQPSRWATQFHARIAVNSFSCPSTHPRPPPAATGRRT